MSDIIYVIYGILIGYLIIAIPKSIYVPKTRWVQGVMFLGKLYTMIANVEGKVMYTGPTIPGQVTKHDLVDLLPGEKKGINIYFFLWPFFWVHKYPLKLVKVIKKGQEEEGDVVIRESIENNEIWIERSSISDHLEFREEYPSVSIKLSTKEFGNVFMYTNNMIEVVNGERALFMIKNWYIATTDTLNGALKGLVSDKILFDLNQFSSEDQEESFSKKMKDSVNRYDEEKPGLGNFGLKLFKSVFVDFEPADDKTKQLMDSYVQVTIATETGKAKIETETQEAKARVIKATSEKEAEIQISEGKKQALIKTGRAKVDSDGNIIELVPDPNIKAMAEAKKELSKLKGTLVMGSDDLNTMLNINPSNKEE